MAEIDRREAALRAPMGPGIVRDDTRIVERPGWYQMITPSAPRGTFNEVTLSQLAAGDAERILDETVAEYQAVGQTTKWCTGWWTQPADFEALLERRRFVPWEVRAMGCDTSLSLALPTDVTVEEVDDAGLEEYLATSLSGWSIPPEQLAPERLATRRALAERPRAVHLFVARVEGACVGTAALFLREGYGYLVGSQVLAAARGRGAYRCLVAARLELLRRRGITLAVTQAREKTSAPILERLGWSTICRSRCWLLEP